MREGRAAGLIGTVIAMALRRVRMLTVLVMVVAGGLILSHDLSWSSIAIAGAILLAVVFGWFSIVFWLWVFRNARGRRET